MLPPGEATATGGHFIILLWYLLEGVYMASFRPKRGGNESPTSIEFVLSVYMMPGISAEPTSSVLAAEALPFVSAASAM